jgi:NADPH:quinone reductase
VLVPPHLVFPLPDEVDLEVAAGLPMNLLTVHFALLDRGRLRAGERLLVHGAAVVSGSRRSSWPSLGTRT